MIKVHDLNRHCQGPFKFIIGPRLELIQEVTIEDIRRDFANANSRKVHINVGCSTAALSYNHKVKLCQYNNINS